MSGWLIIEEKLRNIFFAPNLKLSETLSSKISRFMTSSTLPLGLIRTKGRKNPYCSLKRLIKLADVMRDWLKL